MFSRDFRGNTKTQVTGDSSSVEPEVRETSSDSIETLSSRSTG